MAVDRPEYPIRAMIENKPVRCVINWSHPVARGLVICLPFQEPAGIGTPKDLVRGDVTSLPPGSTFAARGLGRYGNYWAATSDGAPALQMTMTAEQTGGDMVLNPKTIQCLFTHDTSISNSPNNGFHLTCQRAGPGAFRGFRMVRQLPNPDEELHVQWVTGAASNNRTVVFEHRFDDPIHIVSINHAWTGSGSYIGPSTTWANGRRLSASNAIGTLFTPLTALNFNHNAGLLGETNEINNQWHLFALWNRVLGDSEVMLLDQDPFCYLRSGCDPHRNETLYAPWQRRMPCPDFNSRRVLLNPINQTTGKEGIVLAEKAHRITEERVQIRLTALDSGELKALREAWDGGEGQVKPFWMLIPGEIEWRRYIFEGDRLAFNHQTAQARSARLTLLDVTRHGNA